MSRSARHPHFRSSRRRLMTRIFDYESTARPARHDSCSHSLFCVPHDCHKASTCSNAPTHDTSSRTCTCTITYPLPRFPLLYTPLPFSTSPFAGSLCFVSLQPGYVMSNDERYDDDGMERRGEDGAAVAIVGGATSRGRRRRRILGQTDLFPLSYAFFLLLVFLVTHPFTTHDCCCNIIPRSSSIDFSRVRIPAACSSMYYVLRAEGLYLYHL